MRLPCRSWGLNSGLQPCMTSAFSLWPSHWPHEPSLSTGHWKLQSLSLPDCRFLEAQSPLLKCQEPRQASALLWFLLSLPVPKPLKLCFHFYSTGSSSSQLPAPRSSLWLTTVLQFTTASGSQSYQSWLLAVTSTSNLWCNQPMVQ